MVIDYNHITQIILDEFSKDVFDFFDDLEKDIVHYLESRKINVQLLSREKFMHEAMIQILLNRLCRIIVQYPPEITQSLKRSIDYLNYRIREELEYE